MTYTKFALLLSLWNAGALLAQIRTDYDTSGHALARRPVFRTAGVAKAGTVIAVVQVSREGAVERIKSMTGEPELQPIVTESLKSWTFVPSTELPSTFRVSVLFGAESSTRGFTPPAPPPLPYGAELGAVNVDAVPADERGRLLSAMGLQVGAPVTEAAYRNARIAAGKIDPALLFVLSQSSDGKLNLKIMRKAEK